ncbi:MAG TPA: phage tail tube protein [Phycisphaerae bacterium]|nr:phage tail tube protein [Phycisphaerae bacterium]
MPTEMTTSQFHQGQLGLALETNFGTAPDAMTNFFPFNNDSLRLEQEHVEADGMTGDFVGVQDMDVQTTRRVAGGIEIPVRYVDVALLLRLITGTAASPYILTSTLPSFAVQKRVGASDYFRAAGCKIRSAEFSSSQSDQVLKAMLDLLGISEARADSGTAATYSAGSPFLHKQLTLTVGSTSVRASGWTWKIDNQLLEDAYRNSPTLLAIPRGDRVLVTGTLQGLDWNSTNRDLYTQFVNGTWAALEAVYNDGSNTLTVACPKIKIPEGTPVNPDSGSVLTDLPYRAKVAAIGDTDIITITLA